jgi:Tol biopolymer transport system component
VSPDGSRIAYTWNATRPEAAVRVISASGSEPGWGKSYPGTGDDTYLAPAAWMPDGASLLVYRNRKDRTSELAILNLSDGSLRTIASFGSSVWDHVSVSPDGRFVAYDMTPSGNVRDIYVRAIDGSGESAVVVNAANDHHPMWSPDGTRVLFVSDRVRNNSLWSVPVSAGKATGEAELLRSDLGTFLPLGITRSGAIYYTSGGYSSNIGGGLTNVYVSQLDENSNPVGVPVLATQQYFNSNAFPSWAPDGETLGYFSQRAPSGTAGAIVLVIRNMRTGTERVIQAGLELTNNQIAWFPDGKFVLVAGSQNGKPGLYRVSLESAKAEFIVPNGGARFVLSRDGKWMYYIKPGDGVQLMVRRDLPSGNEVELKRRPQNDRRPWTSLGLSPDGKELAYAIRDDSNQGGSIEAIPAEGGASRLITSFTRWIGGDPGAGLYWTPDGRYVMFAHGVPDQGDYIWRVAASGGEGENMRLGLDGLPQTHKVGQPSVSPTGRSIAYTTSDQSVSEVWALENALSSQVR